MKIDFKSGDLVIRRAQNGFVVYSMGVDSEYDLYVYEFEDHPLKSDSVIQADAVLKLLADHFESCLRNKHRGGLSIEVKESGHAMD